MGATELMGLTCLGEAEKYHWNMLSQQLGGHFKLGGSPTVLIYEGMDRRLQGASNINFFFFNLI